MKGSLIVLDQIQDRKAAALIKEGRVEDLLIAPAENILLPGAICRAIAERPLKGQGGVFLRLPDGNRGFLRQTKGIAPGQSLLVQVVGLAQGQKAIPVTTRLSLRGRYAIVTPDAPGRNISRAIRDSARRNVLEEIATQYGPKDEQTGMIIRSRAEEAEDNPILQELAELSDLSDKIAKERDGPEAELLLEGPDPHEIAYLDWPDADEIARGEAGFAETGVLEEIDGFLSDRLELPGGGFLTIEPTQALVAVDVDTGPRTGPGAGLACSIEAARELPRQLRCRGLGGQIVVDFAPTPKRDRHRIEQVLRAAFRGDTEETVLAGWTPLGLFELQRRRGRLPLKDVLRGISY